MVGMRGLWLPILLSAVFVFVVSSIIHMVLPWHKSDYPDVPDEDRILDALRPFAIPPGDYLLPKAKSMDDLKSPAFREKLNRGPKVVMTVMQNGDTGMGKPLTLWFVYLLVVSACSAYVAGRALPGGASHLAVFRFAGVAAFLGYALALWQQTIWFQRGWTLALKGTFDGLIYALITAGVFGWLWPR